MFFYGRTPSKIPPARARYRTLIVSAFSLACAVSLRAQAPATSTAAAAGPEFIAARIAELRSPDIDTRTLAGNALLKAGPSALRDILPRLTARRTRIQLLKVIGAMGPAGVAELVRLTADPALSAHAAEALSEIARPDSAAQIPGLAACLKDRVEIRDSCGRALARVSGPKAAAFVPALLPLVADREPAVRLYALLSLAQIGPGAGRALAPALKALGDSSSSVRAAAARAVGAFSRPTPEARAALTAASQDADKDVSLAAKDALKALAKGRAGAAPRDVKRK
jgi:HEAT repeat protein